MNFLQRWWMNFSIRHLGRQYVVDPASFPAYQAHYWVLSGEKIGAMPVFQCKCGAWFCVNLSLTPEAQRSCPVAEKRAAENP